MIRLKTFLLMALLIEVGQPLYANSPTTYDSIITRAFLKNPNDNDLPYVVDTIRPSPEVQKLLHNAFHRKWILGYSSRLTIPQFKLLHQHFSPFGISDKYLLPMLCESQVPARWEEKDFRDFVKARLHKQPRARDVTKKLAKSSWKGTPKNILHRMTFLLEICDPDTHEIVIDKVDNYSTNVKAVHIDTFLKELDSLAVRADLRYLQQAYVGRYCRILGEQLYKEDIEQWSEVNSLERVVLASHGPRIFVQKATPLLRRKSRARTNRIGNVLLRLIKKYSSPEVAYKDLQERHSADWFNWLHQQSILQELHQQDMRLLQKSYITLKDFANKHYVQLFPIMRDYYYCRGSLQEDVFCELLRPQAQILNPDLVLKEAVKGISGKWTAEHCEILALECLQGKSPIRPADFILQNASCDSEIGSRLNVAITIYKNLIRLGSTRHTELNEHLNRQLLDRIAEDTLNLLFAPNAPINRLLEELEPLAVHIKACKQQGADPAKCQPLIRLEKKITAKVEESISHLPTAVTEQPTMDLKTQEAIQKFVQVLRLSLQLRNILSEALGRMPPYIARARAELRERVFGLGGIEPLTSEKGVEYKTLYWEAAFVRFRVQMLRALDVPLRECLQMNVPGIQNERELFWVELILPLSQIYGFLQESFQIAAQSKVSPPHINWVLAGGNKRWKELFAAVQTDRWLGADDAVFALAQRHLQETKRGIPIWKLDPGIVFAGYWSRNANLLIYKRLLEKTPPQQGNHWALDKIAAALCHRLEEGEIPVGPRYLSVGAIAEEDIHQDLWSYAHWADNLITAYEWQQCPFRSQAGTVLSWKDRLHPGEDILSGRVFTTHLKGDEALRKVDGDYRYRLCSVLYSLSTQVRERNTSLERLLFSAEVAMLLPNGPDNAQNPEILQTYHQFRQKLYRALAQCLSETAASEQALQILRHMMWLTVSNRNNPNLKPTLKSIIEEQISTAEKAKLISYADRIRDIQAEQYDIEEAMRPSKGTSLEVQRVFLQKRLKTLLPDSMRRALVSPDKDLYYRDYLQNLAGLTEERVRNLLRMRKVVDSLVAHVPRQTVSVSPGIPHNNKAGDVQADKQAQPVGNPDLRLVQQFLELMDCMVWYTRGDFKPQRFLATMERGSHQWYPAIVVLACLDNNFQRNVMALRYQKGLYPQMESLCKQLFLLNEARFAIVRMIAKGDNMQKISRGFRPVDLTWEVLDFRLLAKTSDRITASAETLLENSFTSVGMNMQWATWNRQRDDQELKARLFGSMSYCLPGGPYRRPENDPHVNFDNTVLWAARLVDYQGSPQLNKAAKGFLSQAADPNLCVLENAATVEGFMHVLFMLFDRLGQTKTPVHYRKFYYDALTQNGRLDDRFYLPIKTAFFLEPDDKPCNVARQREDIESLLRNWHHWRKERGVANIPIYHVFESDLSRIITTLLAGFRCPNGCDYIFRPVDEFKQGQGPLDLEQSRAYFSVVHWWHGLAHLDDSTDSRLLYEPEKDINFLDALKSAESSIKKPFGN